MNYRELLKKYINHIGEQEGIDFLSDGFIGRYSKIFSEEDVAELRILSAEADKEI